MPEERTHRLSTERRDHINAIALGWVLVVLSAVLATATAYVGVNSASDGTFCCLGGRCRGHQRGTQPFRGALKQRCRLPSATALLDNAGRMHGGYKFNIHASLDDEQLEVFLGLDDQMGWDQPTRVDPVMALCKIGAFVVAGPRSPCGSSWGSGE